MTSGTAPAGTLRLLQGVSYPLPRGSLEDHLARWGPTPGWQDPGRQPWRDGVLDELEASGLTGRGGAGFPLARKVRTVGGRRRRPIVLVNAMEGEPASQKDALLALFAPHLILDGAEVLARALGGSQVSVCCSERRRDVLASFEHAVTERQAAGHSRAEVNVLSAPARYITGEESAIVQWLGKGRALPTFRPDRPAIPLLRSRPVLVDNVETLAHVGLISRFGAPWFRSVGTAASPGTTLLTISGAVRSPGVYEVAHGTRLDVVLHWAGASVGRVGGVLLGGYGGTWLGPTDLSTPLSAEALTPLGSSVGAGVVVVLPADGCGLTETARVASWMAGQSGGQCGPCVYGLADVAGITDRLARSQAPRPAVLQLSSLVDQVDGRGACRHPDGVARLVRSALRVFAADVDHHVSAGPCPGADRPTVMAGLGPPGAG